MVISRLVFFSSKKERIQPTAGAAKYALNEAKTNAFVGFGKPAAGLFVACPQPCAALCLGLGLDVPGWAVLAEGPCKWGLARALPRAILGIIPRALARAIYGPHRAILTDIPSAFPCTFPRATLRVPSLGPPLGPSPIGPLNRALPRTSPQSLGTPLGPHP